MIPLHRGAYRVSAVAPSFRQRLLASCLAGEAWQPTESALEDALVRLLRRHRLPEPRRQYRVRPPGGSSVRLDLAYPDVKLALEADGRIWHSGRSDFERDRARANALTGLGWATLRFGWDDVRHHGDAIADAVSKALRRASGPPANIRPLRQQETRP